AGHRRRHRADARTAVAHLGADAEPEGARGRRHRRVPGKARRAAAGRRLRPGLPADPGRDPRRAAGRDRRTGMSVLLALGTTVLLVGTVLALVAPRAAAATLAAGCAALTVVGFSGAAMVELGDWLGFGQSALRVDGLAGIFLALAGVTGAA